MDFNIKDNGGANITLEWNGKRSARPASPQELEMWKIIKDREQENLELSLALAQVQSSRDDLIERLQQTEDRAIEREGTLTRTNGTLVERIEHQKTVIAEQSALIMGLRANKPNHLVIGGGTVQEAGPRMPTIQDAILEKVRPIEPTSETKVQEIARQLQMNKEKKND